MAHGVGVDLGPIQGQPVSSINSFILYLPKALHPCNPGSSASRCKAPYEQHLNPFGLSIPCPSPHWRKERIPDRPYRLHVELLTLEDDLAAFLVLPILEVARHVHPADDFLAARFVLLADDEIHIHRLSGPVVEVALVFHSSSSRRSCSAREESSTRTPPASAPPPGSGLRCSIPCRTSPPFRAEGQRKRHLIASPSSVHKTGSGFERRLPARRAKARAALVAPATLHPWVHLDAGIVLDLALAGIALAARVRGRWPPASPAPSPCPGALAFLLFVPVLGQVVKYFRVMERAPAPQLAVCSHAARRRRAGSRTVAPRARDRGPRHAALTKLRPEAPLHRPHRRGALSRTCAEA